MVDVKEGLDKVADAGEKLSEFSENLGERLKQKEQDVKEKTKEFTQQLTKGGGKGASDCVAVLVELGNVIAFVGSAAAVGSLVLGWVVGEKKSDEMVMLEAISEKISTLSKSVDSLPDKIEMLFKKERIQKAINDMEACQNSWKHNRYDHMANEIGDVKQSVYALRDLLKDQKFMTSLAVEAQYKPGVFVAKITKIVTPYMDGIKLISTLYTHEKESKRKLPWRMSDIDKQCKDVRKEFGYDEVFESIKKSTNDLQYVRSGDVLMIWNVTRSGVGENWHLFPDRKKWIKCSNIPDTKAGCLFVAVGDELAPETSSSINLEEHGKCILKINDLVALSIYKEYIYRYAGNAFGGNSGYCCCTATKTDAKYQGGYEAAMLWEIESATGKPEGTKISDNEKVYFRCNLLKALAGADCYLTYGSDGYLTTSSSKQVYRIRSSRLMSEEDKQVYMFGSVEEAKKFEKKAEEFEKTLKQIC